MVRIQKQNTAEILFAFSSLSDFTAYSVAKPGGVYQSKSTVAMQAQRKTWLLWVKYPIVILSSWPRKELFEP